MSYGLVESFDFSEMDQAIEKANKSIKQFAENSEAASKKINESMLYMSDNGLAKFIESINKVTNALNYLNSKGIDIDFSRSSKPLDNISISASNAIDKINEVIAVMDKITIGGKNYTNKSLNNINSDIDGLRAKLASLRQQMETALDLEKVGGLGIRDRDHINAITAESEAIMKRIQILERERYNIIQNSKEAIKAGLEREEAQKRLNEAYSPLFDQADDKAALREKAALNRYKKNVENIEKSRIEGERTAEMYRRMFDEIAEKEKQQHEKVKLNAEKARKQYEDTLRMYERMFDEADRKETKSKEEAARKASEIDRKRYEQWLKYKDLERRADERAEKIKYDQMKRTIEAQNREFQRAEKERTSIAKREAEKRRREAEPYNTIDTNTANKVMGFTRGAESINQHLMAIKKLEEARAKLNEKDLNYKETLKKLNSSIDAHRSKVDEATGKTKQLKQEQSNLMDISGQLARRLALVFSVSSIRGYLRNLAEVRGDFEIQQRSLQILLQNKEEANEIWDKTVALAVKSPFRVKDLVTYTKQLAAYRIESEKLYETNKMLADISAGLGVDMNRLILAYGQVKAAAFLRGTELRQFSEAGVNMLDELAKYFTEIEGRAVSVADVFAMVSKRMVSFSDVEEIMKRITSEGGQFYKMQEKQSETLLGMQMNLRDSVDLMMNDIGKQNEGVLKGSVEIMKKIVDNWRALKPAITAAGVAMLTYFGGKGLLNMVKFLGMIASATKALIGLRTASAALAASSPIGALAVGLSALITYIYQAVTATSELADAMREVESNNNNSLQEAMTTYVNLAETVRDLTKSNEDRDRAMANIKSKYEEILPQELLEREYIESVTDNYESAKEAMLGYYNAKAREQKKQRVDQLYQEEISETDIPELERSIRKAIEGDWNLGEDMKIRLKSGINQAVESTVEDIKNGKIPVDDIWNEIRAKIAKYSGTRLNTVISVTMGAAIAHQLNDLESTLRNYAKDMEAVSGLPFETYDQKIAYERVESEKQKIDQALAAFNKAKGYYSKYIKEISGDAETVQKYKEKILSDISLIISGLPQDLSVQAGFLEQAFARMKEAADKGAFEFTSSVTNIEYEFRKNLSNALSDKMYDGITNKAAYNLMKNFDENLDNQAENIKMNKFQKAIIDIMRDVSKDNNVNIDLFAPLIPKAEQNLSTLQKIVEGKIEGMKTLIEGWEKSMSTGVSVGLREGVFSMTKEEYEQMKVQSKALEDFLNRIGHIGKKQFQPQNRPIFAYKERIKVIDDLNKKYKELRKNFSEEESIQGAFEAFKDAFANAYKGIGFIPKNVNKMNVSDFIRNVLNFPNENDIVDFFDKLEKTTKDRESKLAVLMAKGNYTYDLKLGQKEDRDKALIKEIEDAFSGYEITLDLQKLNIPPEMFKELFNMEAISLPQLKTKVESKEKDFIGTDNEDKYKKYLDKVKKMEDDLQMERLKKYSSYLVKAQSERLKIEIDTARQIEEIDELKNKKIIDENVYSKMYEGIQKEREKKIDKSTWADFKDSDMYIAMFEDLERISSGALETMMEKLQQLKGSLKGLSPTELKDITAQINKIQNELEERNPFQKFLPNLKEYISYLKERNDIDKKYKESFRKEQGLETKVSLAKTEVALAQAQYEKVLKTNKAETIQAQQAKAKLDTSKKELDIAEENLKVQTQTTQELFNKIKASENLKEKLQLSFAAAAEYTNAINQAMNSIANSMESIFGSMSDKTRDIISGISEFLGGISQVESGISSVLDGKIITGSLQAVSGVFETIASLFRFGDKKKERKIKKEIKLVEQLEKVYEKLRKAMDESTSTDELKKASDDSIKNINERIAANERMIKLEDDKKKTDKDKIKNWEEENERLKEERQELIKGEVEKMGGTYDYRSATRDFVDAWLDAFRDTGNGLSGLKENFKEFFLNIVTEQAVMTGANAIMKPLFEKINKALENDYEISDEEYNAIDKVQDSQLEKLDKFLTNYYSKYGDLVKKDKESELSGLQKGIQGITEAQADILAAYLNSIRFFVSDSNLQLKNLASVFGGGSDIPNPMISQLMNIASTTRAIHSLLDSLTAGGHRLSGRGLKVFLD